MVRHRHPDLPKDMLLSIDTARSRLEAAHFCAGQWEIGGSPPIPEIVIRADTLADGPEQVLGALLHECAHALSFARGLRDSDRNQRHNRHFEHHAKELGLEALESGWRGWALTKLTPETVGTYADELGRLAKVLTVKRAPAPQQPDKNLKRYACGCQPSRSLRMWPPSFEAAPLTCPLCGQVFRAH